MIVTRSSTLKRSIFRNGIPLTEKNTLWKTFTSAELQGFTFPATESKTQFFLTTKLIKNILLTVWPVKVSHSDEPRIADRRKQFPNSNEIDQSQFQFSKLIFLCLLNIVWTFSEKISDIQPSMNFRMTNNMCLIWVKQYHEKFLSSGINRYPSVWALSLQSTGTYLKYRTVRIRMSSE